MPPEHLGEPEVDGGERAEQHRRRHGQVEVADHEEGVVQVHVRQDVGQEQPGEAAQAEHQRPRPSANSMGVVRRIAPRQTVPSQPTPRITAGTEMIIVSDHEALAEQRAHAGHEHVMAVDHR